LSSALFKFNDYKKKQERNILITTMAVYNLKGTTIKRRIDIDKIKAVTVSKIGTEFIIHVPEEYDYRYASSDRRDQIIFSILRACRESCGTKLPIYYR
jgi:serum/glucocorticoid-regulated kinase 2